MSHSKMVYDSILVIRGILFSKEDVLEIKNIVLDPTEEEDFLFKVIEKYIWDKELFLGSFQLHTWTCCSKLNGQKFILGKVIGSYGIEDMFHGCVELDHRSTFDFDPELKELAKKYNKSGPDNYILLNDCTFCT